jgi:anti-anti-sigma regulatory factor
MMKFYLIVARGKKKGMAIPISVDLFLLGSDKMCQLRSHKPGIAAQHCALVTRDMKVFVRDLSSGEKTLLNGNLVPPGEELPLHAGDRLALGPLEFVLQFRERPLSGRDLEEWALRCLDIDNEREIYEEEDFRGLRQHLDTPAQAAEEILALLQAKRGVVKGRLRIGRDGNVTLVRINDINLVEESEIALIKMELYDNLSKSNLRVLLDCKNIRRMSTAAVAMIDELATWLKPWGSKLALCRVRPELKDILPRLNLHNYIPHFADKQKALATKW